MDDSSAAIAPKVHPSFGNSSWNQNFWSSLNSLQEAGEFLPPQQLITYCFYNHKKETGKSFSETGKSFLSLECFVDFLFITSLFPSSWKECFDLQDVATQHSLPFPSRCFHLYPRSTVLSGLKDGLLIFLRLWESTEPLHHSKSLINSSLTACESLQYITNADPKFLFSTNWCGSTHNQRASTQLFRGESGRYVLSI